MEYLKSDLVPMFVNLAQDEQVSNVSIGVEARPFMILFSLTLSSLIFVYVFVYVF